jgi:hypothetical protein
MGEFDRAVADFDEGIRLESWNAAAFLGRAEARRHQGQHWSVIEPIWFATSTPAAMTNGIGEPPPVQFRRRLAVGHWDERPGGGGSCAHALPVVTWASATTPSNGSCVLVRILIQPRLRLPSFALASRRLLADARHRQSAQMVICGLFLCLSGCCIQHPRRASNRFLP